jgi:hypothetical protein
MACSSLGPQALKSTRTDYNLALRQTEDEQLLLNIVRLRYRDRMYFLEPSSVNTQFTFAASVEPSFTWLANGGRTDSARNRLAVEERPTITYRPLRGKEFVERILAPIPLETLILLGNSGWPISRVMRTTVEQINGIENGYRSFRGQDNANKDYRKFIQITEWLRELEQEKLLFGAREADTEEPVLLLAEGAKQHPAWSALQKEFAFAEDTHSIPLRSNINEKQSNAFNLMPRSFDNIMFFLSQSVQVPEQHIELNLVPTRNDASGTLFDERSVSKGLFRVYSSVEEPETATVKVFYREHWFYIKDSDFAAKSTFSMLNQIFALQSGGSNGSAPILTIPIGN